MGQKRQFWSIGTILVLTLLFIGFAISPNAKGVSIKVSNLTIEYSTFFGSTGEDDGYSMAFDNENNMYLTGATSSSGFNTTSNAYMKTHPSPGIRSAFVTKFSPSGDVLYSSFLGGIGTDTGTEIALDSQNNILIVGITRSNNFPLSSDALDSSYGGGTYVSVPFCCGDGFITKFSSNWTLLYSSYIGGTGSEADLAIQLDTENNIYVSGSTMSTDFPTTSGAFQTSNNGGNDLFITKFTPNASTVLYSTLLGGSANEIMKGGGTNGKHLAVDSEFNTYVTAGSESDDYPTTIDGYDQSFGGNVDAVVTKLSSDGSSLVYSTYLGGDNLDTGFALDLDNQNNVVVIGNTDSANYPITSNAAQGSFGGGGCGSFVYLCGDGFVTSLSKTGDVQYSTYLGGSLIDAPVAIKIDSNQDIGIVGFTDSTDFPLKNANEDNYELGDTFDLFVSTYSAINFDLVHSTRIGGTGGGGWELANGINTNHLGEWFLTGFTTASNFYITSDAYDTTHNGNKDVIIVKLGLEFPKPIVSVTTSTSTTSTTSTSTSTLTSLTPSSLANNGEGNIEYFSLIFGFVAIWVITRKSRSTKL